MKGLVVTRNKEVCLKDDIPMPEIGDYEALVKIECCMICNGTDLGVIHGDIHEVERYPAVLGHEDAGRVVKVGAKVTSYKVGDRVVRAGQHNSGKYASAWGGFAEFGIVKDYEAIKRDHADVADASLGITQQVCPREMKPEDAALLITLKETYSAIARIGAANARRMVIIGDGPVALAFLVCGKLQGIQEIYLLGNHKEKLDIAKKLGAAKAYCNKEKETALWAEKELVRNAEFCVDTIGCNATINQCMDYICDDGVIAVYGLKNEEKLQVKIPELRNFSIQYVQWPIPETEAEAHKPVVQAIMNHEINTDAFITLRLPVTEYEKGFQVIQDRTALKVVLYFSDPECET